jgi:hypothetical protein
MISTDRTSARRGSEAIELRRRRKEALRGLRDSALRRPCPLSRRPLDDGGCRAALMA